MDVVRQTIVTQLKGTIEVESTPGQGSAFVLKLPLTLAIIQVIVARAGGETFAIPARRRAARARDQARARSS